MGRKEVKEKFPGDTVVCTGHLRIYRRVTDTGVTFVRSQIRVPSQV